MFGELDFSALVIFIAYCSACAFVFDFFFLKSEEASFQPISIVAKKINSKKIVKMKKACFLLLFTKLTNGICKSFCIIVPMKQKGNTLFIINTIVLCRNSANYK